MVKQPLPPIRLLIEEPYIHRTLYFSEFASKTTFFQNCHFLLSGFDFVYFTEAPNVTRLDLLLLLNYTKSHQKPKGGRFPSYSLSIKAGSSNRTQHVHFKPTDIGLFLK